MATEKQTANEHGVYVVVRHETNLEFVCDRCLAAKIAKLEILWTTTTGAQKRICNGCYGRLRSGMPL